MQTLCLCVCARGDRCGIDLERICRRRHRRASEEGRFCLTDENGVFSNAAGADSIHRTAATIFFLVLFLFIYLFSKQAEL